MTAFITNGSLPSHRRKQSAGSQRDRASAKSGLVCLVRRAPGRERHRGLLVTPYGVFPCRLGRSGVSRFKREGDGATPAARLRVLSGFCRRDRLPLLAVLAGLRPLTRSQGWCDDPTSPAYNRPVHLPARAGHERLWRDDRLYDVCLVLDWNIHPRARRRGSAIFLHLTSDACGPTRGCIAVDPRIMQRLLAWFPRGIVLQVLAG
ncbi:MAG: L,D-transpeptidase family protein [Pseudomonadota bacterium]|nr:L,D-transpeptidase family protein [Pseudomonadota bacterium]